MKIRIRIISLLGINCSFKGVQRCRECAYTSCILRVLRDIHARCRKCVSVRVCLYIWPFSSCSSLRIPYSWQYGAYGMFPRKSLSVPCRPHWTKDPSTCLCHKPLQGAEIQGAEIDINEQVQFSKLSDPNPRHSRDCYREVGPRKKIHLKTVIVTPAVYPHPHW